LVDTNTLFQAASISKPVTATVVHRLVQSGTLDLDVPVNSKHRFSLMSKGLL
jgi:CubicO group peptidase (beta-lactamase class C family)